MIQRTRGEKIFSVFNYIFLTIFAFSTLYPFLYTLTMSVSTDAAAEQVGLHILPDFKNLNFGPYKMVFKNASIWNAYKYTLFRAVCGTLLSLVVTCFYGYALSRPKLPMKKFFTLFIMITMMFNAGQIPNYLNLKSLGLINNILVYILPYSIVAYNVIIARSFFASLPESLNESAKIDGAGELRIFFQIIVPLSKPIIMTLALWDVVKHWNMWLDSVLYMNDNRKIVVQHYIQRIINEGQTNLITDTAASDGNQIEVTAETIKAASIMVATAPILAAYPFIQKYFVTGVTLGAVKG